MYASKIQESGGGRWREVTAPPLQTLRCDSGRHVRETEIEKILEELEELESIRAYDAAKAANDESIPLDQAFREIEQERQ
jgi:hypothetical protein|tara:strand:- start:32 stop:271 length:240 start_codon:yes stop_codon:yes gene_type:complete